MRIRSIILVASATSLIALAAACAGSMEDATSGQPIGSHAALVSKKHDWLKNYHDDCQVCFRAFEQCKVGAADASEQEACQIALDACVRGGLGDTGDEIDGDADDPAIDGGSGASSDDNADDVDAADAGTDEGDGDDGDDEGDGDDASDAGADDQGGGGDQDPGKIDLIDDISECLDQVRACIGAPNSDTGACISGLKSCVRTAIHVVFDDLCSREISACVKERVPEDALQSVRDLCEEDPAIAP